MFARSKRVILLPALCLLATAPALAAQRKASEPPWYEPYRLAALALGEGRLSDAASKLLDAALAPPDPDAESVLFAATLWVSSGDIDRATAAVDRAIDAGWRDADLLEHLPALAPVREREGWDARMARVRASIVEHRAAVARPDLLDELSTRWQRDQSAHEAWARASQALGDDASAADRERAFAPLEAVLEANQERLLEMVDTVGWPGQTLVGEDGAKLAWSLAQHAPSIAFKRYFLHHLAGAVADGEAPSAHYAELHDRIARDTWEKQRFGASWNAGEPDPMVDASRVDRRRARLGLRQPIAFYGAAHEAAYTVLTEAEAAERAAVARRAAADHMADFWQAVAADDRARGRASFVAASAFHGDLDSEVLFRAAVALAGQPDPSSHRLSLRVLNVLVGRPWRHRFTLPSDPRLQALHTLGGWSNLLIELDRSAPRPSSISGRR